MSVTFFQDTFGRHQDAPTSGRKAFASLFNAVVTGTVGIYDIVFHMAVWGALIFLVVSIIQFFNSSKGMSRDAAKGKVMRELGIFLGLTCVLSLVSILIELMAGVYE